MILADTLRDFGQGPWVTNPVNETLVPMHFVFPQGGTIRIEGRNSEAETETLVALAYRSETVILPHFKQYRIVFVRANAGGYIQRCWLGLANAGLPVRMAPSLQFRKNGTSNAGRNRALRNSWSLQLDNLNGDRSSTPTGTSAKDFENCRSGEIQSGETEPYSIKITTPVGANGEYQYNYTAATGTLAPVDITGGTGVWPTIWGRVFVDAANAQTIAGSKFNRLILGLEDGSGRSGNIALANYDQVLGSAACGPGWLEFVTNPFIGASFNPADVVKFRLFCQPLAGNSAQVTLDALKFLTPTPSRKYVAFRDDDCFPDAARAVKEFDKWGIRATLFMKPGLVGTSASCSLADIKAFQASGHSIAHQGWNRYQDDQFAGNTYLYYTQSPEEFFRKNILPAMMWMQDNGFEKGARIFAPEQGNMSAEQRAYAFENGIEHISMCNTPGEQATHVNHLSLLRTTYSVQYPSNTVVNGALDDLDSHGGLLTFLGHATTSKVTAPMLTALNRVLPKIKDGTYQCITFDDVVSGTL